MMNLKIIFSVCALGIMTGCHHHNGKAMDVEMTPIKASEIRESNFFTTSYDFMLSEGQLNQLICILKEALAKGETNIGFRLVSNKFIPIELQEIVKKNVRNIMYEQGFIDSRIVDLGTVIYKAGKPGIRVDILKYHVKDINVSPWDTEIGDGDIYKNLPRYGSSAAYNLNELIDNKADFVRAREYKMGTAGDVIGKSSGSSSGSSSSSSSSSSGSSSSSFSSSSSKK